MNQIVGILLAVMSAIITVYITFAFIFFFIFWIRNYDVKITDYNTNEIKRPTGIKKLAGYLLISFTWPMAIYNGLKEK